jgi:hypothetical protein
MLFVGAENGHGDMTSLVCLDAFYAADQELEQARLRWREAAETLTTIRKMLGQAVDLAYEQQSFGPLNALFDEEEVALAVYEQGVFSLAEAEERWFALRAALAYEKERMAAGPMPRGRMN